VRGRSTRDAEPGGRNGSKKTACADPVGGRHLKRGKARP
jgi:hypothetical protein